jgi:hypothetical protein
VPGGVAAVAGAGSQVSTRDDLDRCEGGDCTWRKLCKRWVHRLTGTSTHPKMCPGTGPRTEQPYFVEEPR